MEAAAVAAGIRAEVVFMAIDEAVVTNATPARSECEIALTSGLTNSSQVVLLLRNPSGGRLRLTRLAVTRRTHSHTTDACAVGDVLQRAIDILEGQGVALRWHSVQDFVVRTAAPAYSPLHNSLASAAADDAAAGSHVPLSLHQPLASIPQLPLLSPTPITLCVEPALLNISR